MWCLSCLSTNGFWSWASGHALKKTTDVRSKKRLKCDRFRVASIPPLCRIWGVVLLGIREVHVSRFGERGKKRASWSCPFRTTHTYTHTHAGITLPPAVHHKPSASHLIWTWWYGAQIYDILCTNLFCLTSLFSNFLSASGGNLLFTWQEHQTLMHRFAAAELPLRTCFFCVYSFQCPLSVA